MGTSEIDDQIISDVIKREGGLVDDPSDPGGRTFEGISERANPDLWRNGPPTDAQVRQRYEDKYVKGPGFDGIGDTKTRGFMVDWAVTSGPAIPIQALQRIVGVPSDGVMGPQTLTALTRMHPEDVLTHLVAERVKQIGRIVEKSPSQVKFLGGWLDRTLSFLF
jgi:lysozyme family protein